MVLRASYHALAAAWELGLQVDLVAALTVSISVPSFVFLIWHSI
jgi:hypothetical protein